MLSGCFTGVESTPRITASDVKKQKISETAEQRLLANVKAEAPSTWQQGKCFRVTDDKISIIFSSKSTHTDSLAGKDIYFQQFLADTTFTGKEATDIILTDRHGSYLSYRVNLDREELVNRDRLEIPFTVETSIVQQVDSILKGNTYYIISPLWYNQSASAINGIRHVAVKIESVEAGNHVYPLAVNFKLIDETPDKTALSKLSLDYSTSYKVYMTLGNDRSSTRNFDTLFAFDNPRHKYPNIATDTWQLIIQSKVAIGMSRDECKLALGAPRQIEKVPTSSAMLERWSYDDGIFLIFEDGILTRYRL
jgi:hypothetical protein